MRQRAGVSRLNFLGQFLRNPREIGSITPSSRYLGQALLAHVDFERATRVVELGPGTGVFTRQVLGRLSPHGQLLAVETNAAFVDTLRSEIADPRLTVANDSAEHVDRLVADRGWDGAQVVMSGLPYSLLPTDVTANILEASKRALAPGGTFVGYQYSRYLRRFLLSVFGACEYHLVLRNIPPAFVYVARR